jgi:hypothetical protein
MRLARRESVGIKIEDFARLALRRACLVSRFNPLTLRGCYGEESEEGEEGQEGEKGQEEVTFDARVGRRSARAPGKDRDALKEMASSSLAFLFSIISRVNMPAPRPMGSGPAFNFYAG